MRKKYQSVLLLLLTLLLIAAVMYWYNRKIENIERKMRDEPALKIPVSPLKTGLVKPHSIVGDLSFSTESA